MLNKDDIELTIIFDKYNVGQVSSNFSKKCHYFMACNESGNPYLQYDLNQMAGFDKSMYTAKHNNLNEHNKSIRKKMMDDFEELFQIWSYDIMMNPYPEYVFFTEKLNKELDEETIRKQINVY